MKTNKKSGFTLFELTIVLAIIALIFGAVLVGEDMINTANLRMQIREIERYNASANTFRNKYGEIPGDIRFIGRYFDSTEWPDYIAGDGNKRITDANLSSAGDFPENDEHTGEIAQFWHHLSIAGMIDSHYDGGTSVGSSVPWTINERCGVGIADVSPQEHRGLTGNSFQIGITGVVNPGVDNSVTTESCLRPAEAYQIDFKIDNGRPQGGRVFAVGNENGTDTGFFRRANIFDIAFAPPALDPLENYAQLLLNLFISSAYATSNVPTIEEACFIWDSSAGQIFEQAVYNTEDGGVSCQLAIRASF